ncbi:hypothetical protein [Roseofilum casamattae]|uniref:Uncharacterized protein n=1 Tax=Roseofilum casamattae BLCC-M143 TaxID=3022442 RepID=A0ABT7BUF5_9CYAN|nr:hypothetical protein [Roseofilum casamattae]MDJ1182820.1 hypothetical protein [Roseofilum casamattae BLCC-M143]
MGRTQIRKRRPSQPTTGASVQLTPSPVPSRSKAEPSQQFQNNSSFFSSTQLSPLEKAGRPLDTTQPESTQAKAHTAVIQGKLTQANSSHAVQREGEDDAGKEKPFTDLASKFDRGVAAASKFKKSKHLKNLSKRLKAHEKNDTLLYIMEDIIGWRKIHSETYARVQYIDALNQREDEMRWGGAKAKHQLKYTKTQKQAAEIYILVSKIGQEVANSPEMERMRESFAQNLIPDDSQHPLPLTGANIPWPAAAQEDVKEEKRTFGNLEIGGPQLAQALKEPARLIGIKNRRYTKAISGLGKAAELLQTYRSELVREDGQVSKDSQNKILDKLDVWVEKASTLYIEDEAAKRYNKRKAARTGREGVMSRFGRNFFSNRRDRQTIELYKATQVYIQRIYQSFGVEFKPKTLAASEVNYSNIGNAPTIAEFGTYKGENEELDRVDITLASFKNNTKKYGLRRRGNIFKTIDKLLDRYLKLKNTVVDREDLAERKEIIEQMKTLVDTWKNKHIPKVKKLQKRIDEYHNVRQKLLDKAGDNEGLQGMVDQKYGEVEMYPADKKLLEISNYLDTFLLALNGQKSSLEEVQADTLGKSNLPQNVGSVDTRGKKKKDIDKNFKKIKAKYKNYDGDTGTFFGFVVPQIIDSMAPQIGDYTKFELQLRFPTDPTASTFVGGRFVLQTERKGGSEYKVRFEGLFQAGGTARIAAIAGELGIYFETIGSSPEQIGKLLSYGLYRRFRESRMVHRSTTNYLWGDGTTVARRKSGWKGRRLFHLRSPKSKQIVSDEQAYLDAEEWAARVEKEIWDLPPEPKKPDKTNDPETDKANEAQYKKDKKDYDGKKKKAEKAYIEMGGLTGGLAEIQSDPATGSSDVYGVKGKAAAQYFEGRRYDRASIKGKDKTDADGNVVGTRRKIGETEYKKKGRQKTRGRGMHKLWISGEGSFGNLKAKGKLKLDWMEKPGVKMSAFKAIMGKWELKVEGIMEMSMSHFGEGKYAGPIAIGASRAILRLLSNLIPQVRERTKGRRSRIGKEFIGDLMYAANDIADNFVTSGKDFGTTDKLKPLLHKDKAFDPSAKVGLNVTYKTGKETKVGDLGKKTFAQAGRPQKHELNVYLQNELKISFLDSFLQARRQERILQWKADWGDKWSLEILRESIKKDVAFESKTQDAKQKEITKKQGGRENAGVLMPLVSEFRAETNMGRFKRRSPMLKAVDAVLKLYTSLVSKPLDKRDRDRRIAQLKNMKEMCDLWLDNVIVATQNNKMKFNDLLAEVQTPDEDRDENAPRPENVVTNQESETQAMKISRYLREDFLKKVEQHKSWLERLEIDNIELVADALTRQAFDPKRMDQSTKQKTKLKNLLKGARQKYQPRNAVQQSAIQRSTSEAMRRYGRLG